MKQKQNERGYLPLNELEPADQDIWIVDGHTIKFYGVPFATRMTIVRLSSGALFCHSLIGRSRVGSPAVTFWTCKDNEMQTVPIQWSYAGVADPLCGTGATRTERLLAYGIAALFTAIILVANSCRDAPIAEGWRIAMLAFFAFDIAGGAVANMLNSCKRFYHGQLQPSEGFGARIAKNSTVFTAIHIHPIIAAYVFGGSTFNAIVWYVLLQAGVAVTLAMPLYLRRAGATAITLLALLGDQLLLPLGTGLEWFIPCLFTKMVLGHAVQEEPYRPTLAR